MNLNEPLNSGLIHLPYKLNYCTLNLHMAMLEIILIFFAKCSNNHRYKDFSVQRTEFSENCKFATALLKYG